MTASAKGSKGHSDVAVGNSCLLQVMNQHFFVEIIEITDTAIRVSFPGRDYPVEGMPAELQFHDKNGFYSYPTIVVAGPCKEVPGIALQKPKERRRAQHRDSCRVATDLTVQVKDQVHVRRYNATLINLSAGGMLVETDAPFDFSTCVEIMMSLPGEPAHTALAQIVHIGGTVDEGADSPRVIGLRFVSLEPQVMHSIGRYIWQRLRDEFSPEPTLAP